MDKNQFKSSCTYLRNKFDYPAYRISMSSMISLAALITTVLNSLVLISIWKTPSLHKPSYILIGSVALSDLLVGAIAEPMMITYHIADLRGWSVNNFCLAYTYARVVTYALGAISLLTLVFISLDRLLAVKLRNRYQSVVTQKRVLRLLVACWITSSVISAVLVVNFDSNSQTGQALLLFVGIGVVILIVTITVCYSMTFYTLRKITSSSVSPSVQNGEVIPHLGSSIDLFRYRRSRITMFVVSIFTILFYAPVIFSIFIASLLFKYKDSYSPMLTDIVLFCQGVALFFALLYSAMNPLLYLWRIRDIGEAVKTTVKKTLKVV